ncbi:MAG: Dihydroorotase [Candidatus Gottesmanbacteria bacterium GW2011_GWA2_42_16]|nr:MAG: Dihydroorotase [Candidatus Gottesmanbacteria bacterium GW2011_GWA2_42_16]
MKNTLYGKDILSAGQFDKKTLELILTTAQKMKQMVKTKGGSQILRGKVMTALFFPKANLYQIQSGLLPVIQMLLLFGIRR